MTVYAVFKEGIYRHECGGVFSTMELAKDAAIALCRAEPDGYHNFEVVPFQLDGRTAAETQDYDYPPTDYTLRESDSVFTVKGTDYHGHRRWYDRK